MKVTITHLKAPWPEGSKVGDVVGLEGDTVPGWALGKCVPAAVVEAEAKADAEAPAAVEAEAKAGKGKK